MQNLADVPYRIKEFNEKNRAVEATKALKAGDIIMELEPIAYAAVSKSRKAFCNVCIQQKDQLLRCSGCATLYYCSIDCQKKDWKIHKQQCKIYSQISKFNVTAEFILLVRMYLKASTDKAADDIILSMLDLDEYQTAQKREHFRSMAASVIEYFKIEKTQNNLSMLYGFANRIAVNAFTVQDYLFSCDGVGIAIYHPANFINHSCHPNCVQVFDGTTLRIIALTKIDADEEITISYIDQMLPLKERNYVLRKSYLFDCGCYHCMAQKSVKADQMQLLCLHCEDGSPIEDKGKWICTHCKNEQEVEKMEERKRLAERHKDIMKDQSRKYGELIESFLVLRKIIRLSSPEYATMLENLYLAALEKAVETGERKYYENAYKVLKSFLLYFKVWHLMEERETFHPLLLWKYAEAGKLAMHLGKYRKAVVYTEGAVEILKKCRLRQTHKQVRELLQRQRQLQVECRMYSTRLS